MKGVLLKLMAIKTPPDAVLATRVMHGGTVSFSALLNTYQGGWTLPVADTMAAEFNP